MTEKPANHGAGREKEPRPIDSTEVADIKAVLSRYNGDDRYGELVYDYYLFFKKYNAEDGCEGI